MPRRCPSLPPAARISARGLTSRIRHSARRQRSGVSEPSDCTGLPSIGIRKFTGIDGTSSSRSRKLTSTTSALDSPIPRINPLHASIPHFLAATSVRTRSA